MAVPGTRVQAIRDFKHLITKKDMRTFLGTTGITENLSKTTEKSRLVLLKQQERENHGSDHAVSCFKKVNFKL